MTTTLQPKKHAVEDRSSFFGESPDQSDARSLRVLRWIAIVCCLAGVSLLAFVGGRAVAFRNDDLLIVLPLAAFVAGTGAILINRIVPGQPQVRSWVGTCIYLLVVALSSLMTGYKAYNSAPSFIIENLKVIVRVDDAAGSSGSIHAVSRLKVLKRDLREIVWEGPSSTGTVKNLGLRVLNAPYRFDTREAAGKQQVTLSFDPPLKRMQEPEITEDFEVKGAPPEPVVYWEAAVVFPTGDLQMTLLVPPQHPCKTVEARSEDSVVMGNSVRTEHVPSLSADGTTVNWSIHTPQEGRRYIVACNW